MSRGSSRRLYFGLTIAAALVGLGSILLDWDQIRTVLGQARWEPLPFALASTIVSYLCISFSFARVSRLLGIRMRLRDLTATGFVTTILNHIVASGGAAGYTIRYMLMSRHGVSLREVIAASILHFYLTSLVMIAMLPVGLTYLLLHASIDRTAAIVLGAIAFILLFGSITATGLVFWSRLRRWVINGLAATILRVLHRDVRPLLDRFDATIAQGVIAMRQRPSTLAAIMVLIVMDWATSSITLWFCFQAFGTTLQVGDLISGFVLGVMAGVVSLVPGGLVVQEGSMAGVFALLGIPIERGLLASILFRIVYYLLPYLASLGFYWRMAPRDRHDEQGKEREFEHANPDAEPRISPHH